PATGALYQVGGVGVLAYLLPYLEQEAVFRELPPALFNGTSRTPWWSDPNALVAGRARIKTFLCPSDAPDAPKAPRAGEAGSGTWVLQTTSGGELLALYATNATLGASNYIGSAGAMGNMVNFYGTWCGPYYLDSRTRLTDITDGTSHT